MGMPECRTPCHTPAANRVFMVNLCGEDRLHQMFHHHAAEHRMKEYQE
jgi:hypothetical protein